MAGMAPTGYMPALPDPAAGQYGTAAGMAQQGGAFAPQTATAAPFGTAGAPGGPYGGGPTQQPVTDPYAQTVPTMQPNTKTQGAATGAPAGAYNVPQQGRSGAGAAGRAAAGSFAAEIQEGGKALAGISQALGDSDDLYEQYPHSLYDLLSDTQDALVKLGKHAGSLPAESVPGYQPHSRSWAPLGRLWEAQQALQAFVEQHGQSSRKREEGASALRESRAARAAQEREKEAAAQRAAVAKAAIDQATAKLAAFFPEVVQALAAALQQLPPPQPGQLSPGQQGLPQQPGMGALPACFAVLPRQTVSISCLVACLTANCCVVKAVMAGLQHRCRDAVAAWFPSFISNLSNRHCAACKGN